MAPMQNTIMFIIIVWATFLARVKPVSTRAKPACMKKTRKPATSIHIMLIAVARSVSDTSSIVRDAGAGLSELS